MQSCQALKEWSVAIDALTQGNTIVLLRKGGIHEQKGTFTVKFSSPLLYPTLEHQRPEYLKPEYAQTVQLVPSGTHPDQITLQAWAEITDQFSVTQADAIAALFPFHIWNEAFIRDRLQWKPQHPINILLLRTYLLPIPVTLQYRPEYGGCRSWIELAQPLSLTKSTPALTDSDYRSIRQQICHTLQQPC